MTNIVTVVKNFLKSNKIDLESQKVIVAFSGGYDSMCLLNILASINKNNITAIHLNHNWRGEESLKEEIACRDFCSKLGVNFYSERLSDDVKKTETAAREARYKFFEACAEQFNSRIVFTAHNANDNAETILYRIVKGTGINGLCGIAVIRDIYYRPLLTVPRDEIEEYCISNGLSPNKDSSNQETKYNRNYIRHNIFPLLKHINPDVIKALNSLSDIAKGYNNFVSENLDLCSHKIDYFFKLSDTEKFFVIKNLLCNYNLDYDRKKIEDVITFMKYASVYKSGKKYSLRENLFLYVNDRYYEVVESTENFSDAINITSVGKYILGNYELDIQECKIVPNIFPKDHEKTIYANIDELNFTFRTRQDGDYICPLGLHGKQKLKKYLNEKKIPQHKKNSIPLLCRSSEVFWVVGIGINEKLKVKEKVTHVLTVKERVL